MAAITRLSLDGYGARRTGNFAGKEESEVVVPEVPVEEAQAASYWPGYVPPRRKRRKKREKPVIVEVAHQQEEIKYVSVRAPVVVGPSLQPVMDAVEQVTRLIEARASHAAIREKIEELEEIEDIVFILSQLQ